MRNSFRNHLHSILFRIFTICTIIGLNCNFIFASSTVGQLNQSVSFDFLSIASFKASSNAYFSNTQADPTYLTTASLLGSFINTFGPRYSYQINSFVQGTPAGYIESKDVNLHLRDISSNQWYINDNIMRIRDYMDPLSQVVSDIKTNTTNEAATLSAMNILLNTLDWQSSSAFGGLYDEVGGTALSSFTNQTKGTVYARFGPLSSASNLFKLTVPIFGGSNSVRNSYISGITLKTSNMQTDIRQDQYLIFYDNFVDHTDVYLYLYAPISTYFFLKIDLAYNISYNDSYSAAGSYYLGTNSPDYVDFMNYLSNRHSMDLLKDIKDKDFTAEIDGSTIEIDNSINVTPIELDVSIGIQDFTAVNTVSNKLRTWLSTGVGVVDLIAALDQLDDTFFTLHNRSVIETISTGYTDYYD